MSKLKLTTIISLLTVSTLAFSACDLVAPDDPKLDNMTMQDNTPRMEGNEDAMMDSETEEGEAMMEGEDSEVMTDEDETMMDAEAPKYVAYTAEMYEMLKGEKPFVIYFHATWCPTCNVLDGKIKDAIADFPAGTIILNADYDEQTELKKEFGVNKQTTLVSLDKDGNKTDTLVNPSIEKLMEAVKSNL